MSEQSTVLCITGEERDRIWEEIKKHYERSLRADIDVVMLDVDEAQPAAQKILKIHRILQEHDKKKQEFDRLLHRGKTEAEERKAFFDRLAAEHKEQDKKLDDMMKRVFGDNPFEFK